MKSTAPIVGTVIAGRPMIPVLIGVLVLAGVLFPSRAFAQSTDDDSVFDFSLPGARSRAMGGAFVAIADDATSVYSNPAGLTTLFRPEVSFEARHWTFTNLAVDQGHAYGAATNIGLDTLNGIRDREFKFDLTGLSFLSFAYPKDKWAVGVFYHQLARYQMNRQMKGAFFDCIGGERGLNAREPFCEVQGVNRLFPADQAYDLSIRGTGATVARHWMLRPRQNPDPQSQSIPTRKFSLGVTLQYFKFDLEGTRMVYNARGALNYATADWSNENVELIGTRTGDDWALGLNAGVLYDLTEKIAVGTTFRQGPKFQYLAQTDTGAGNPGGAGHVVAHNPAAPFKVPDTWAVGVAIRPNNSWRIGIEYDRVMFAQLIDQIVNTAHVPSDPEGWMVEDRLVQDNANQLRIGGEYSMTTFKDLLLSVRGGFWYDPLHQPYLRLDNAATGAPAPGWSLLFPKREANSHATFGVGIANRQQFQVDIAVDYARSVAIYAASTVWRF